MTTSHDSFTRACRRDFAFLVRDYSFTVRASASQIEASVMFVRPDALVVVYTEWMSEPWVTVKIGRARSFGLHTKIARLDPDYARRKPSGESAVIAYHARFLRTHVRAILGGLPRKPPEPEPARKPRATRAGALDFLVNELGWASASEREFSTKQTKLHFHKGSVRLAVALDDGRRLACVRISARTKEVDLDDAIAKLAPDFAARRPKEQKARLAFYAEFLRTRGAALLAGKRSAWSRMP